jgi:hypothetical protein
LLWFTGLFFFSYVLARGTMGIRSWIRKDSNGKHILCLRDNISRANAYIPFEYISKVERCEYTTWLQDNTPPAYRNLPYHRTYTQFAYQGPGLIVSYTSPNILVAMASFVAGKFPPPRHWPFSIY